MNEINRELIGARLKERRELCGLTQEQVGDKIGKKFTTVAKYESGEIKNIDIMIISTIADLTNTDIDYLLLKSNSPNGNKLPHVPLNKGKTRKIPVVGKVAAGFDVNAIVDIIGWEEIDETFPENYTYFGLIVQGNSMEPRIYAGDVVIVRAQPDIESGEYAIVRLNGDDATIKRISKDSNGITLIPLNSTYLPKFYSNEDIANIPVEIIGKVVELRGKF